ncbi:MAG: glycosyltransferase N-terminal domain-containing protein [Albidovulum sp.]|uniref:3-deoxy-D-manno-octulosonic acid transferase n=1 Tax=Albidovulum sp. TaxID=1872424 RepID=UPI003C93BBA8
MARSLALALYLISAGRGGTGPTPERAPRPDGPLLWLHLGHGETPHRLSHLATRLMRDRPDLTLLMSCEGKDPTGLGAFPSSVIADLLPPDNPAMVRRFLDHWRPDTAVLTGPSLPPAMIVGVHDRGIPLLLADIRMTATGERGWRWRKGMAASLLGRFRRILAQDPETATRLRRLGGRGIAVDVAGRIEETAEPLPCNERERASLAELVQTRPIWLAAGCNVAEEDAIIAAHSHAMRLAHRMLLILSPADAERAPALAERLRREGWIVAKRTREEEPEPEVQVLVTDGDVELGLWYRLAPVTFMGGTLLEGGPGRNPFEPAAFGSAILHGSHAGAYPDAYARLTEARATRLVTSPSALAEAVSELIAADKAAILAHNAWAASSGGAEVAERVTQAILAELDAVPAKAAV